MNTCSRRLFDGIIDYAGLFPPAELPMDEAFSRFAEHRSGGDGWILAHFICPASRLEELEPLIVCTETSRLPIPVSVLGRGGDTLEDFLEAVSRDEKLMAGFADRLGERVVVDAFEVRLPAKGGAAVAVNEAWGRLTKNGSRRLTPFFEVSLLGEWRSRLPAAVAAVRDCDRQAGDAHRVGLKIRCGGLEADAIPEVEAVAAAIATCRATDVPLKATQGLHHPFRHHDPDLGAMEHGFINLFAASALTHVHDLPVKVLIDIVAETDPQAMVVGPEHLSWRDYAAPAEGVTGSRRNLLTSFGSCSFSEPRDGLRSLGFV
jgi:hypothetical protein